jgi:hypothetical protein
MTRKEGYPFAALAKQVVNMAIEVSQSKLDPTALDTVVQKSLTIARTAEAVALRSVKKVQLLFFIGIVSAVWLTYYVAHSFELTLVSAFGVLLVFALPPLLLGKLYGTLRRTIGLPQRLRERIESIRGKTAELGSRLKASTLSEPANETAKLSELWRQGKVLLEVKSLGGEAQEIASVLGEALILANPVFAVLLLVSTAVTVSLLLIAIGTWLVHVL